VRVGVLANANSPNTEEMTRLEAARALHLALTETRINKSEQLAAAFAAMKQAGMGGVLFRYDLWFIDPKEVAALVRQYRLPTIHNLRQFVEAGALVSYGVDFAYLHRRSATYVDKILKGAKPADLPVEQPTKFEVVINLKTAKTLGLAIPRSVLTRAKGADVAPRRNGRLNIAATRDRRTARSNGPGTRVARPRPLSAGVRQLRRD